MPYTSIYRKYRPDSFESVIGQEHIVRTLKNQIKNDTVGHAYVFTGTRGTGKTSVAKIFARAVNCLADKDGSPCGICENCVALSNSSNFDVLEIDAASNNSVDQMRELTDKINFPPTVGKYKVYIIDEVHMLSKSAFNALLKTLEEPPSHAIFILATTEIHQIPQTVLSRCLRFDFRLVSTREISARLKFIFDDMGVKYQPEAVDMIASSGAGSVRDAMSVADMCVSYSSGNITYDNVLEVLGASDPDKILSLATALADGDAGRVLSTVAELQDKGKSTAVLASDLAGLFRDVIYIKNCAGAKEILALPGSVYAGYKTVADNYSDERCLFIMKKMASLEGEFRYSSQHRVLFEAAAMQACSYRDGDEDKIRCLESRIAQLERKISAASGRPGVNRQPATSDVGQIWKAVASGLEREGFGMLALAAIDADVETRGDDFVVKLGTQATLSLFTEKSNRDAVNRIFNSLSDKRLVFEEVKKLDEDKALPYIKTMFGSSLEIK